MVSGFRNLWGKDRTNNDGDFSFPEKGSYWVLSRNILVFLVVSGSGFLGIGCLV